MKFDDVLEGGMLNFPHKAIMVACCTCGLSHMFVFMTDDNEPCLKVYRDDEATEAVRAGMSSRQIEALIKEFQTLRKSNTIDKSEDTRKRILELEEKLTDKDMEIRDLKNRGKK